MVSVTRMGHHADRIEPLTRRGVFQVVSISGQAIDQELEAPAVSSPHGRAVLKRTCYGLRRNSAVSDFADRFTGAAYNIGRLVAGGQIERTHAFTWLLDVRSAALDQKRQRAIVHDMFEKAKASPLTNTKSVDGEDEA